MNRILYTIGRELVDTYGSYRLNYTIDELEKWEFYEMIMTVMKIETAMCYWFFVTILYHYLVRNLRLVPCLEIASEENTEGNKDLAIILRILK